MTTLQFNGISTGGDSFPGDEGREIWEAAFGSDLPSDMQAGCLDPVDMSPAELIGEFDAAIAADGDDSIRSATSRAVQAMHLGTAQYCVAYELDKKGNLPRSELVGWRHFQQIVVERLAVIHGRNNSGTTL